jgi:hypothetical protein
MATLCRKCGHDIQPADIHVEKDVAYCRGCNRPWSLSDLVHGRPLVEADLASPPAGCWYRDEGGQVSIGASMRTVGGVIGVLLFGGFWNGISWTIFLSMLRGSSHVSGPGITHTNGQTAVGGIAYLFISPFLLIGAAVALALLMVLFGRTEVVLRGQEGTVFTGVGPVGRRRAFDVAAVTGVAVRPTNWMKNDQPQYAIYLDGLDAFRFGSTLTEKRRDFVAAALRKVIG